MIDWDRPLLRDCLRKFPTEAKGDFIFADDAVELGFFEDYARKMYPQYKRLDVPTWIIGPPIGRLDESRTPTQVMKVWPNREPIMTTTADAFNAELDNLLERHCLAQGQI